MKSMQLICVQLSCVEVLFKLVITEILRSNLKLPKEFKIIINVRCDCSLEIKMIKMLIEFGVLLVYSSMLIQ